MHKTLPIMLLYFTGFAMAEGGSGSVPVMIGGNSDDGQLDACASLGAVSGLDPKGDRFLAVRSGPGTRYLLLDKLLEGQKVFACSVSPDRRWYGVVYTRSSDEDCGITSPVSPPQPYSGKCDSGWVNARWVKIIAG
jgi:hypothetical protein